MSPLGLASIVLFAFLSVLVLFFFAIHYYIIYCLKDFNRYMKVKQNASSRNGKSNTAFGTKESGEEKFWDERNLSTTIYFNKIKKLFNK